MTTHTLNGREVLLVDKPEGFYGYKIMKLAKGSCGFFITDRVGDSDLICELPPGNTYSLPSPTTVAGMSEEVAATLVEQIRPSFGKLKRYMDYEYPESGFCSALESLCSFIKLKSLDPDRVVMVIKEK